MTEDKININEASAQELASKVEGFSETLAQKVVDYRDQNGPFKSVEDLEKIPEIGKQRMDELKDQVEF